jgi:hypothetical protein
MKARRRLRLYNEEMHFGIDFTRLWLLAIALIFSVSSPRLSLADPIPVRFREGVTHGFLILRSLDGAFLADGDLIQVIKGDDVTCELVFRFKDGSIHDETAVFSQHGVFRLITDHLIQQGPSFPRPIDALMNAQKSEVTIRSTRDRPSKHADPDKNVKSTKLHFNVPVDDVNGMMLAVLRNISSKTPATKVSWVALDPKPQKVTLAITPGGEESFTIGGMQRQATNYTIKIEISGIRGVIAPIIGKQPPDLHFWILTGKVPTFLMMEGQLYRDGPIWRMELANVQRPAEIVGKGL